MESITLTSTTLWKCAIYPTETGVYKVTKAGDLVGYIIVEDSCPDDIRLKWLGENGFYKFGNFIRYTSEKWNPKDGASVNVFNYDLSTAKASESLISKNNQRSITLRKINVPTDFYKLYMDLAKSPKVYLNVGDGVNDIWIEVKIKWSPNLDSKRKFHQITIDVEFPNDFIQRL